MFVHAVDPTLPKIVGASMENSVSSEVVLHDVMSHKAYRKGDCFVKSETLNNKRLDSTLMHPCVQVKGDRLRCVLCCSRCTSGDGKLHNRETTHSRRGHLQRFECATCNVALCKKSRFVWMGKSESCFSLFHKVSQEELTVLLQSLCAVANPAETAFGSMINADAAK